MENKTDDVVEEADESVLPSAPPEDDDLNPPAHKLENLKMTQIKANVSSDLSEPEWTVVYSDSNSSVLSGEEEDDDDDEGDDEDDEVEVMFLQILI